MKKKIILIILILICFGIVLFLALKEDKTKDEKTYKDVKVSKTTIENTITSSGEVTSDTTTIELNTYRYFSKMYYEVGDLVKKGEKIIKYTNGTYYKAPYDLVITGFNLPDSKEKIRSNNYLEVKKVSTLKMTLDIDETEISKVSVGNEVKISLNAFEDEEYSGKITFINQIGNYSNSGTKYTATIEFDNNGNILLGMSGTASVTVEKAENVIAVPIESVMSDGNKKYVIVVDGNNTKEVEIETGISSSAYVEVKSGLTGDETIRMIETESSNDSFERGNIDFKNMNFDNADFSDMKEPPSNNDRKQQRQQ